MIDRRLDCDPNRLRRFLEETPDEDDRAAVAAHLDHCESCRDRLEAMAAGGPWWAELRRFAPGQSRTDPLSPCFEADAQADPPDFLDPPDADEFLGRFGPYQVIEVVGSGGMGVVLKAFDPALHRVVAIKVMAPQLAAGAAARLRFTREARAAASIAHDHAVTIHAVDAWKGLPYIVMSYVAGRSLQERLDQDGPMSPREIVRVGMQVASGLAAAHAQGLVHRDIKPSNILLENGVERVKITDFGLARTADDASLMQSVVVFGTPQYMSPEQAQDEPVDHRADLFSLGCVMYAMAAGRSPFRAETPMAVLRRVCEDRPRPLRDLNPDVPDWLERIVAKLLAKDPADRFRSADEVAGLLERCLAHLQQPKQIPLPELPEPLADDREAGRRRAGWRLLVALTLAGVLVAFGALVIRIKTPEGTLLVEVDDPAANVQIDGQDLVITGIGPREFRLRTGPHRVTATSGNTGRLDEVVTIVKDGKTVVRVRQEPPASGGAVAGDAPVDPALPKSPRFVRELAEPEGPVSGVSFLAGGLTALMAVRGGGMWIWDLRSAWELYNFRAEGHRPRTMTFVPSPRALTGGEDGSIVLWSLPDNREIRRFRGHVGAVRAISHPRGTRRFVSAGEDGTVRLWDIESGEEIRQFRGHRGRVLALDLTTGTSRLLLTGGEDGTVRLWDLATGETVRSFGAGKGAIRGLSVVPNGRHVVFGGDDRLFYFADIETGWVAPGMVGHTGPIVAVSAAGDWRHALTLSEDGTMRVWDLVKYKERGRVEVPGRATVLDVSDNSRLTLTGGEDGITRLWLIPLAPGEAGSPTPTHILSPKPDAGPRRPQEFLQPMLQNRGPTTN
jgi:serine/threonine protein kinase/WD40 repeat protein